jgi:hypothetical protein
MECQGTVERAIQVTARLMRPLCREFLWPRGKRPALAAEAVRDALVNANRQLLEGAADFLRRSMSIDKMQPEEVWARLVKQYWKPCGQQRTVSGAIR